MKVLVAEDDSISSHILQGILAQWGYEVLAVRDGVAAWQELQRPDAPELAVLDWNMPGMDGAEVCRRAREQTTTKPPYLILLTSRDAKADIVRGLQAGADDYLTKPYDREELQARLEVGRRMVTLRGALADRIRELEEALGQVKQLQGLLPICMFCKKIRDDKDYWKKVEDYISERSNAQFSHGICPDCFAREFDRR